MVIRNSLLATLLIALVASTAHAAILESNGSPYAADPSLKLWLDASNAASLFQDTGTTNPVTADGQAVARWTNSSSYGGAVWQTNAGNQPSYAASVPSLNNMPALYFDGDSINGGVNLTGIAGNQDRTVISLWSDAVDNGANYQHTIHIGNQGTREAYGHSVYRGNSGNEIGNHYYGDGFDTSVDGSASPTVAVSTWDDGTNTDTWWVNGAAAGTNVYQAINTGNSQLKIGSRLIANDTYTEGIRGNLAEVIVYDSILSQAEINRIGGYLQTKYGFTIAGADLTPGAAQAPVPTFFPSHTVNNFDSSGTPYTIAHQGGSTPAQEVTASGGNTFLRLVNQENNNRNFVAFDRTSPDGVENIKVDWDMRAFKTNTNNDFGDGFSIALVNTDTYGDIGIIPALSQDSDPESWPLVDSFSIGFDSHPGGQDGQKNINVFFDGAQVGSTIDSPFDYSHQILNLNDPDEEAPWDHGQVLVDFLDTGGANVSLYLGGDETEGSGIPIFEDLFIPNMDSYAARLAFGGRTGGAVNFFDLDNINMQFAPMPNIPEPSTFALAILALVGMAFGIHRRKK